MGGVGFASNACSPASQSLEVWTGGLCFGGKCEGHPKAGGSAGKHFGAPHYGISRSARLAALHVAAGVLSVTNLCLRACAPSMDRALRADNSSIRTRTLGWLSGALGVQRWVPEVRNVSLGEEIVSFLAMSGEQVCGVEERWLAR